MPATEPCSLVTHACAQDMLGAMQPLDAGPAAPYHVIFWIFLLGGCILFSYSYYEQVWYDSLDEHYYVT